MQSLNQRTTRDKTLHLVVSFPEGEKPTKEQLQNIEQELLKSIGMAEHPRLSVTHTNTANYHLHIAVSRIDPITLNRIDPHRDIPKLHKKAEELEEKYNLIRNNHTPNNLLKKAGLIFDSQQHTRSKDIEIHSGVSSLLSWIKEEALDNIKEVLKDPKSSLEDLHQVLAGYNLELKPRGNGIVLADKTRKLFVKASDVHRDLSKGKLKKRFGEFKTS